MRVQGQITSVTREKKDFKKSNLLFTICEFNEEKQPTGKEYNVLCPPSRFLPIWVGDYIDVGLSKPESGSDGKSKGTGKVCNIEKFPLVVISNEEEQILEALKKCSYKLFYRKEESFLVQLKNSSICQRNFGGLIHLYLDFLAQSVYYYDNYPELVSKPVFPTFDRMPEKKMMMFFRKWIQQRIFRQLYLIGFNKTDIKRMAHPNKKPSLLELYPEAIKNPYIIINIPIQVCDEIYETIHGEVDPVMHMGGEITRFVHEKQVSNSWSFVPEYLMVKKYPNYRQHIPFLESTFSLKIDEERIYTEYSWRAETTVATFINKLLVAEPFEIEEKFFDDWDKSDRQKEAVLFALRNPVSIILGPPGSGKSSIIGEILRYIEAHEETVYVGTFTGNASRRVKECLKDNFIDKKVIEDHISTLDRMIVRYCREEESTRPNIGTLLGDEIFMCTTELFYRSIETVKTFKRVILLGDEDQLSPISWGFMGESLLKTKVPVFRLTECFRTVGKAGEKHPVLKNAEVLLAAVSENAIPNFETGPFFRMLNGTLTTMDKEVTELKKQKIDLQRFRILSPVKAVVYDLNLMVTNHFLSDQPSVTDKWGKLWTEGALVMATENYYSKNYQFANGEEGILRKIDVEEVILGNGDVLECQVLEVEFFGKEIIKFFLEDSDELVGRHFTSSLALASAKTVHKFQGAEADLIYFYFPECRIGAGKYSFYNYKLIYTAMTRTKKVFRMVGHIPSFLLACTKRPQKVYEHLHKRILHEEVEEEEENEGCDGEDPFADPFEDEYD